MAHSFKVGSKVIMSNGIRGTIRSIGVIREGAVVVETDKKPSTFYTSTVYDLIDVSPPPIGFYIPDRDDHSCTRCEDGPEVEIMKAKGWGIDYPDIERVLRAIYVLRSSTRG